MKRLFTNNLILKITSLGIAFVLWILVVNVSNPEVTRSKNVTVEIINDNVITNAAKTYSIVGSDTVSVSYDVRVRDESKIKASDFRAYIDMAELYDITGSVPVTIEVLNNKDLIVGTPSSRPAVIRIETEDIQQKTFELNTSTSGEPAEGMSVGTVSMSQDTVSVTGPMSSIGLITSMGIEVDVSGATEDMHGTIAPKYYDANGNTIDLEGHNLIISPGTIDYTVTMLKGKALAINYSVSGTPGDGYQFTGAECAVKSVAVVGRNDVLDTVDSITIPSELLNINGATADKEVNIDLNSFLPEGLKATSETAITIRMKIEALNNRTIVLSQSDLNEIGHTLGYSYKLNPERISVVIKGLEQNLTTLSLTDITATIDYTHLIKGTHTGSLAFTLPDGYSVESYTPFEIIVSDSSTTPITASESDAETTEAN